MLTSILLGPNPQPAAITRRLDRILRVVLWLVVLFGFVFAAAFILARIL